MPTLESNPTNDVPHVKTRTQMFTAPSCSHKALELGSAMKAVGLYVHSIAKADEFHEQQAPVLM